MTKYLMVRLLMEMDTDAEELVVRLHCAGYPTVAGGAEKQRGYSDLSAYRFITAAPWERVEKEMEKLCREPQWPQMIPEGEAPDSYLAPGQRVEAQLMEMRKATRRERMFFRENVGEFEHYALWRGIREAERRCSRRRKKSGE